MSASALGKHFGWHVFGGRVRASHARVIFRCMVPGFPPGKAVALRLGDTGSPVVPAFALCPARLYQSEWLIMGQEPLSGRAGVSVMSRNVSYLLCSTCSNVQPGTRVRHLTLANLPGSKMTVFAARRCTC